MPSTPHRAANGGTRPVAIAGADYLAHRVYPEPPTGDACLELEEIASGELVARVSYHAADRSMRLETLRGPVPRAVVEALLELAEEGLA